MKVNYCDKCGRHIYFSDKLIIKSGVDGSTKGDFEICHNCANELVSEILKFKENIVIKIGDIK